MRSEIAITDMKRRCNASELIDAEVEIRKTIVQSYAEYK